MTITTKQAMELRKRITKLVNAECEAQMKGTHPPEFWPGITEELRVAKKRLHEYIDMLKLDDFRRAL